MPNPQPQYVTTQELAEKLINELATLSPTEYSWWSTHRVVPFVAVHESVAHFVLAAHGQRVIFFADDEDEFGVGILVDETHTISDYGLVGNLKDAVRVVAGNAV